MRDLMPQLFSLLVAQNAGNLSSRVITGEIAYYFVRSKDMWCITFTLPWDPALARVLVHLLTCTYYALWTWSCKDVEAANHKLLPAPLTRTRSAKDINRG